MYLMEESKQFYGNVITSCATYKGAKASLLIKHSNINEQTTIRQFLQSSTLKKVVEKHFCNVSKALELIRDTITTYALHRQALYFTEKDIVEYIQNTLADFQEAGSSNTMYCKENALDSSSTVHRTRYVFVSRTMTKKKI